MCNAKVKMQVKKRIQENMKVYQRKEGLRWGISGTTKYNHRYKPVLSPCFKVAGMIHRIF